jgi:hypothetical protein
MDHSFVISEYQFKGYEQRKRNCIQSNRKQDQKQL